MRRQFAAYVVCQLLFFSMAIAGPADRHNQGPKDLSDEPHYTPEHEHNPQYDHEAFLGKEEAQRFDQLSPEEAKRKLSLIIDKIDKDQNGYITEAELVAWINRVANRYIYEEVEQVWDYYDEDGFVTWEGYKQKQFGAVKDPDAIYEENLQLTYRQAIELRERRFAAADQDGDGKLSKEEFAFFLYPEGASYMRDHVIDKRMAGMDKNGDGYVTLDELINHLWPPHERERAGGKEPDWVERERKHFRIDRDMDKDGLLNREEIGEMLLPVSYDPTVAEAKHLIHHADLDKDGKLAKQEILDKQDLFVGSRATEYGKIFGRQHDEF